MTDNLTLIVGVLFYAVLWSTTLGAFRPLSMERSGIYILVTGLGAGLLFSAHRFVDEGLVLSALGRMLGESAYAALILFLRSTRLSLPRKSEILGSVLILAVSMAHLGLNLTLTGGLQFVVMAVQVVCLVGWVTLEAYGLWRQQRSGITTLLLILVSLHLAVELLGRSVIGFYALNQPEVLGQDIWQELITLWMWITFTIAYVVLAVTASVLMDAFRSDKFRLEQEVQQVEARLQKKESALLSLLATHAERSNDAGVASLAHELRQPLTVIQLNAEFLASGKRVSQQETEEILQAILRENQRAAGIVQSLRSLFAKKAAQSQPQPRLDLSSWLLDWGQTRATDLLEKNGVQLDLQVDEGVAVQANVVELEIVLQNLLNNAVDALAKRADGRVGISLKAENAMAIIDVIDNGPGVPLGQHEKIFEMNYSTKPQGMGHGLWLSRHITQTHGGQLVAMDSAVGAHMRLSLPLADQ